MKNTKSLLIFIPSIENGGVEKNLYLIANYLAKKNIHIKVLTALNNKRKLFDKKIKIISLKAKNNIIKSRFLKTFITIILFLRYCIKENILILSFQSNIAAIILGLIFKKKIIVRSNTSPDKYIKNFLYKIIFKFFFCFPDEIIVNSYEFKKKFRKFFSLKPKVIYNPFIGKKVKKINFAFFNDKKSLKIINVARLTDQKDHLTLLKAIKKLKKYKKCKLIIIGRGYKESTLKKYILENNLQKIVKLIGYKENPESYIKISDVFVLSSIYEGLPNVLIEALYLKKYVISSDCSTGPKEILNNGRYGSLFKVKDYNQLFKLLKNYSNKSKKIQQKINQGHKSLNRFDYKNNCKKYFQIISKYF
jgi:glycosyltransferase involved in cell wall biosynthesis